MPASSHRWTEGPYTGYRFNDFAAMGEILRWMATRIPGNRVLVFIPAWDGRYYYDYPTYRVAERMGGEEGFRRLIDEAHRLGFKILPMFGLNAANRRLPVWPSIASGAVSKIDGDIYNINWVDWNNDRHQDGWLTYMNVGEDSWRTYLQERIERSSPASRSTATSSTSPAATSTPAPATCTLGTRRLVTELRRRHPEVLCVGEFPYDALHGFIPMFHVGLGQRWGKYSRNFQHLSSPAPGLGSSGVHESGFGRFDPATLSLNPGSIPTLQVVDDTFTTQRETMAAIIAAARERAGI